MQAIGSQSIPIEVLHRESASTRVVPEPQNGSSTTSFGEANSSSTQPGMRGMYFAANLCRPWVRLAFLFRRLSENNSPFAISSNGGKEATSRNKSDFETVGAG